jgi:REase_AHJR-like
MSQRELLEKVAEEYRQEGYDVLVAPTGEQLPEFLADRGVDLLARRGDEHVAVQVKRRDELYDLVPLPDRVSPPAGWRFDLVVYPRPVEEVPRNGNEPAAGYAVTLIDEAEQLVTVGTLRAAFLVAWSAAEAAMRENGRRERLCAETDPPRFVVKTLYANGILSREEYDRLQRLYELRNRLVHGVPPDRLGEEDARALIDLARRLLGSGPAQADGQLPPGPEEG